jgi:predicted alpha/beta-hydrolase family hydrolase
LNGGIEIETPSGVARAFVQPAPSPIGALVLGHGAGGQVSAPDLMAATRTALEVGVTVALVEQPYLVAGKKSTPPPSRLDPAWTTVLEHLRGGDLAGLPLVAGGRSSGARVACRTAAEVGAVGVLCLAFPLLSPQREGPPKSRQDELDGVDVPVLVVQGENDRFGVPEPAPRREVVVIAGDHGLKKDLPAVGEAVRGWLPGVLSRTRARG